MSLPFAFHLAFALNSRERVVFQYLGSDMEIQLLFLIHIKTEVILDFN